MGLKSFLLLALGALAAEANLLAPRAGKSGGSDDSSFGLCTPKASSMVKSYSSCYTSALSAAAKTCRSDVDQCGCDLATAVVKTCVAMVCPTSLVSSLLSVGCDALLGPSTTSGGAVKTSTGGSGKTASATDTAKAGSGSGSGVRATTSRSGGTGSDSQPQATGAATTGSSSDSSSSAGGNNPAAVPPARTTSTSSAFAGEMAVPVVGGALAGLVGAVAILL